MRRGELWWADLPEPLGHRPVLLLSREQAYAIRTRVTVAPLTTTIRRIPTEVPLGAEEGLPRGSVANLDDIATIPKSRIARRIGALSQAKMNAVREAIVFALALDA
ncbi:MAG: type II toxin-antitoxin system PemK/MazF family toxin [Candidatus Dormibacterales bacterium]